MGALLNFANSMDSFGQIGTSMIIFSVDHHMKQVQLNLIRICATKSVKTDVARLRELYTTSALQPNIYNFVYVWLQCELHSFL